MWHGPFREHGLKTSKEKWSAPDAPQSPGDLNDRLGGAETRKGGLEGRTRPPNRTGTPRGGM